jgi:hypothetical protein
MSGRTTKSIIRHRHSRSPHFSALFSGRRGRQAQPPELLPVLCAQCSHNHWTRFRGSGQGDKSTVVLPILFPETREVLKVYLCNVRPRFEGDSLLVTDRGGEATESSVSGAVKRVADKLNLRCYRSKRRPTPHALRRTFGMLNAAPLGLALSTHELAWRMRDSIKITFGVYVRDNPLLAKLRGAEYRERSKAATSPERLRESLAALRSAGLPARLSRKIELWLEARDQQLRHEESDTPESIVWVDEDHAVSILRRHWRTLPRMRLLRSHFRTQGGLQRSGPDGRVMYARQMVDALATGYQPVADHLAADELKRRAVREIVSGFALLPLGTVKLVAADDLPALSRTMASYRARTVSHAKTDTTIPPKLTQPTTDYSIQSVDNAA